MPFQVIRLICLRTKYGQCLPQISDGFRKAFSGARNSTRTFQFGKKKITIENFNSDQPFADSLHEILCIRTGLFHDLGIAAVFDFCLLQCEFDSNLRFVPSLYEGSSALGESGIYILFCFWHGR